jgi:gluconokinase
VFNYLLDKGTFVCGGATNNAAAVIKWFATNFLQRPNMSLVDFIDQTKNIEAGSEGLIFLPYLFGERAPVYDATASGVFFGASVQHTLLHFQRAVAEGICFALKSILETVDAATPSSCLIVSGGITHSPNWLQMLSDVLGRELVVTTDYDASAMGAAIVAFRSEGKEFKHKEDKATIVLPNYALSARYEKSYAVYNMLYASLKNTFRAQNQSLR